MPDLLMSLQRPVRCWSSAMTSARWVAKKGHGGGGNLFYAKWVDGGASWSNPMWVNSQPGSAMSIGTIRGGHIAVGKNGRVHVAWMGADGAQPRPPGGKATPMLY